MAEDARVEAAAKAILDDLTMHDGAEPWAEATKPERRAARKIAVKALAAADAASPGEAALRRRVAELEVGLREFTEFAWSAVTADCVEARDYLASKINKARALLHPPEGKEPT